MMCGSACVYEYMRSCVHECACVLEYLCKCVQICPKYLDQAAKMGTFSKILKLMPMGFSENALLDFAGIFLGG